MENSSLTNSTAVTRSLTWVDYTDISVSVTFGLLSVVGNTILLVALKRDNLFKVPGFLTLVHFSFCDFFNAILAIFYVPLAIITQNPLKFFGILIVLAEYPRKVFIGYMAISRFWVIVFPMSGGVYFDLWHTKRWLICVWIVGVLISLPYCIPYIVVCFHMTLNQWGPCKGTYGMPDWLRPYTLMSNVVPTALMVLAYPVCFGKILHSKTKVRSQQNLSRQANETGPITQREKNIIYLFCSNAVVFVFYWLPANIAIVSGAPFIHGIFEILRGIQSAYNPFLYFMLNARVRKAIIALFKKDSPEFQFQHNHHQQHAA